METNAVVEHPHLPASPLATADALIEPKQHFRRTVAPGVPLACDRYRSQVQAVGDWDPDVVLALIWRESLCNEQALSPTNDWGLLQLNATCWAGKGIDGLPRVRQLPDHLPQVDLRCDGLTAATPAATWCFHAKEEAFRTGRRPASPCDAWLDPDINLRAAYEIWLVRGWEPWCFNELSRSTPACHAAFEAPAAPQE
ncbi:transglycosylase SLT domain-containing protein [Candidatus Poriferisodalis sp.]|uniref:transglycosylase SLT domain-containing protein n=1 Tax=Candidatus Poriferisodalis sp. TaxID=3101277 RepID=UPI003B51DAF5